MWDIKGNWIKNTVSIINCFKKIESKSSHKFPLLDIKDFYPSIKGLLIKALEFAKQHVTTKSKDEKQSFTLKNIFCKTRTMD